MSILDYFDIQSVRDYIEVNTSIRTDINRFCGRDDNICVAPLLQRIKKMPRTIPVRNRTAMMM